MTETPIAADPPSGSGDGGEAPASELPATPSQRAEQAIRTETQSGHSFDDYR